MVSNPSSKNGKNVEQLVVREAKRFHDFSMRFQSCLALPDNSGKAAELRWKNLLTGTTLSQTLQI